MCEKRGVDSLFNSWPDTSVRNPRIRSSSSSVVGPDWFLAAWLWVLRCSTLSSWLRYSRSEDLLQKQSMFADASGACAMGFRSKTWRLICFLRKFGLDWTQRLQSTFFAHWDKTASSSPQVVSALTLMSNKSEAKQNRPPSVRILPGKRSSLVSMCLHKQFTHAEG